MSLAFFRLQVISAVTLCISSGSVLFSGSCNTENKLGELAAIRYAEELSVTGLTAVRIFL
jgi:hypothetical protein